MQAAVAWRSQRALREMRERQRLKWIKPLPVQPKTSLALLRPTDAPRLPKPMLPRPVLLLAHF